MIPKVRPLSVVYRLGKFLIFPEKENYITCLKENLFLLHSTLNTYGTNVWGFSHTNQFSTQWRLGGSTIQL